MVEVKGRPQRGRAKRRRALPNRVVPREQQAAQKPFEAAEILAKEPQAMQLRYLSSLNFIAGENNSTIIFPFPMELASLLPVSPRRPAGE